MVTTRLGALATPFGYPFGDAAWLRGLGTQFGLGGLVGAVVSRCWSQRC